ncbi:putative non-specific serine/threonine protein kinase [Helianthus annuus]|nr:putative non-specific serine/threonine protein kinase [Helianthus annuus]
MFYNFYFCSKHWSLIIVCPDFKFGYLVDFINEGKTHINYKLVKIIEEVFEINFKWHMAQLWNEEGYFEESQIENLVCLILHEHENPVWQSFDYPTDTLLPNQLLTKNTQLVSSRSSTNYSSGFYKLFFDTDSVLRLCYDSRKTTTVFWPDPGLLAWQVGRYQYLYSERASLDSEGRFNSTDGLGFLSADFGYGPQRMMKIDMDGNLRVYSLVENGATREWVVQWQAISHSCRIHGVCGQNSLCTYSQDSGIGLIGTRGSLLMHCY